MIVDSHHKKTLLKAIATHRRKYEVLQQRVILRSGKYRYSKNAEKLKNHYTNEITCCDLLTAELIKNSSLKRRKKSNFLTIQQKKEINTMIRSGSDTKSIAIKYNVCYDTIFRIKRTLK